MTTAEPPADVIALAEHRAAVRAKKDWAGSDQLRAELAAAGWLVRDGAEGYTLSPQPPYDVLTAVKALPDRSAEPDQRRVSVAVLVEGWPEDVRRCLGSVLTHVPDEVAVIVLDLGNVDGAGDAVHALAAAHPGRIEAWHLAGTGGWAEARTALLRADRATFHVWVDPAIELTGDAITPLLAAFETPGVVEAGWSGVTCSADWLGFTNAERGESAVPVDACNGYLAGFRRSALLGVGGPHPKAAFYRNADLELSFTLREAGGVVVMTPALPVVLHRHRGYEDSEPTMRERQSKKTYDRFLQRFRGKDHLRAH